MLAGLPAYLPDRHLSGTSQDECDATRRERLFLAVFIASAGEIEEEL